SGRGEVLGLIAVRAREITGAALAVVAVPVDGTDTLTVELAIGQEADAHRGMVLPVDDSLIGLAFSTAAPVISLDISQDDRVSPGPPRFAGLGPGVAVPIGARERVRGVVLLVRTAGRSPFTEKETDPLRG
ncbi:GAF domain-containing protein, partial [Streptomyces sp. MK7]|uniref:GAF domain-containing protein n=1 Tax=Streptomyces sp. MK7 TaxID=3067635 RepID=UPI00292F3970